MRTLSLPAGIELRSDALVRRLLVILPATMIVIATICVPLILLYHRSEAIGSGERLIASFAQLTEEQTTRTMQGVDRTLATAQTMLSSVTTGGADEPALSAALRELMAGRPYLRAIRVLDTQGRVIFSTDGNIGLDLSGRAYFRHYRDKPDAGFELGSPLRSLTANRSWFLPATRPWRDATGAPAGVIIASIEPTYFSRVWTLDDDNEDVSIGLFSSDGFLLVRAPFVDALMGRSFANGPIFTGRLTAAPSGSYQATSIVDGRERLIHYRQLSAYPRLVIVVGITVEQVLSSWRRYAIVVMIGAGVATLTLAGLALWLRHEWNRRRQNEERYRLLFDANPHPMWMIDRDSLRFLAVNQAAEARYGWSRDEFLGMTLHDIHGPESQAALAAASPDWDSAAVRTTLPSTHRTRGGAALDVEITVGLIDFEERRAGVMLAQDVTERTRAQQARQAMEGRLRQAQKMEAVGQMTGGIAHDFNNLLAVIIMKLEIMQEDLPPDSPFCESVAGALAAATRGADLVKRLLAFSRRRELHAVKTDIAELLNSFRPLIKAAVPQVQLRVEATDDLRLCMVDRAEFETALLNLSVNARDAMPPGGSLCISASNRTITEKDVALRAGVVAGDWVQIAVSDTGSGIAPELVSKVFEPFFTTKEEGKGTGLGLSMVFGFVTHSGGFLSVDSVVGEGTTISLFLPAIS